jgi:hypothetical protein
MGEQIKDTIEGEKHNETLSAVRIKQRRITTGRIISNTHLCERRQGEGRKERGKGPRSHSKPLDAAVVPCLCDMSAKRNYPALKSIQLLTKPTCPFLHQTGRQSSGGKAPVIFPQDRTAPVLLHGPQEPPQLCHRPDCCICLQRSCRDSPVCNANLCETQDFGRPFCVPLGK